jgi:SAM-dependent methyltransferase
VSDPTERAAETEAERAAVRGPIPPRHAPSSWEVERVAVDGEHRASLAGAEAAVAYEWAAPLVKGRRVLDVGCGVGLGAARLLEAGAAAVTGVDPDRGALEVARRELGERIDFVAGGPQTLPFEDGGFGVVVCFELAEVVDDPAFLLAELVRVLEPGGLLAVSLPTVARLDPIYGEPVEEPRGAEAWAELLGSRLGNVALYRRGLRMAATVAAREGDTGPPERTFAIGSGPGEERAVLALAGDSELPSPSPVAALTDSRDLRAYRDTLAAWEQRARRAEAEGSAKHWELVASREAQRRLRKRLHQLEHRPLRILSRVVRGRPWKLGPGPPLRASEREAEPWD